MFFFARKEKGENLKSRIAELESKVHELEIDLIHDPQTGLNTRKFFEDEATLYLNLLNNAAKSTRKEKLGFKNLTLIFLDIDYFKNVNDTYGHQIGDSVLNNVAIEIRESVRAEDTVARWGGEEFVVLLLGADEKDGVRKANEIREKIHALVFEHDKDFKLTISAGVANTTGGNAYAELLKMADDSLYRAKDVGRNKVVAHSELI